MFRHYDFHDPGAFALRRALKLDAALPDGWCVSNDIVLRLMAAAKAPHHSPTNHR
jgi:hypothetical protein